ncbi:MAG: 16S rRNA (cytosine(1402)-N(4))-methyltransferase, partial [Bacteroidota bacterium]
MPRPPRRSARRSSKARASQAAPSAPQPYATSYHAPVLVEAVVDLLVTDPAGVYVDGTLGGGGHTAALLDRLGPGGRVVGIDQDADAIREATVRIQQQRITELQSGHPAPAGASAAAKADPSATPSTFV